MAEHARMQTILSTHLEGYAACHRLSARHWQVCHHLMDCRTPALGGQQLRCERCAHTELRYHSCRDRHCPRCGQRATERWCERQRRGVLGVTYHHLVFTLPHELNAWIGREPERLYDLLFETVWATLKRFGADPKRLGGQLGMSAVLHTWGRTLSRHVHLHCLVPGGVLSPEGRWRAARGSYLFPVRALARHFRGRFVSALRRHIEHRPGPSGIDPAALDGLLDRLMGQDWVVYSKPCLGHTETVVDYLGRYSHRIGISDARIRSLEDDGTVCFDYTDQRDGTHRVLALSAEEFIRRFLQHVLPHGFMRIRHFGFLANRCRAQCLERIRQSLNSEPPEPQTDATAERPQFEDYPCSACGSGRMRVSAEVPPMRLRGGRRPPR